MREQASTIHNHECLFKHQGVSEQEECTTSSKLSALARTGVHVCRGRVVAARDVKRYLRTLRMRFTRRVRATRGFRSAAREHACPPLWEQRRRGETERVLLARARQLCGEIVTQRNGSGVDDARVCPAPRDINARIMAICAVIATLVFAAQLGMGVYFGIE